MVDEEDCGICGLSLNDKYSYKMSCNHTFHYECLMKTFIKNKEWTSKNTTNACPYCRSDQKLNGYNIELPIKAIKILFL